MPADPHYQAANHATSDPIGLLLEVIEFSRAPIHRKRDLVPMGRPSSVLLEATMDPWTSQVRRKICGRALETVPQLPRGLFESEAGPRFGSTLDAHPGFLFPGMAVEELNAADLLAVATVSTQHPRSRPRRIESVEGKRTGSDTSRLLPFAALRSSTRIDSVEKLVSKARAPHRPGESGREKHQPDEHEEGKRNCPPRPAQPGVQTDSEERPGDEGYEVDVGRRARASAM